ncbi:endoplasmic reticulum oxidoreductin-1-like [Micractinium conductrix]|uniref:Endoplasmic reticulum oxidoreductin-1-like n=1 Tax=Micractinium conductrix TaxID=554055 RepID=A0A2P6VHG2_9CHLO|nr:endoplasmic reticulum oxidoreductin-1-like [Micractinium conductrix]|eukprot:PSC73520.1 endoplasmic reticulum oxidoreductin-1-like [Micractinium conductrix]
MALRSLALSVVAVALAIGAVQQQGLVPPQLQAQLDSLLAAPPVAAAVDSVRRLRAQVWPSGAGSAGDCSCGNVTAADSEQAACNLAGNVTDCCCTYGAVERLNRDEVQPLLDDLVKTPFFRYFKVDLYCECPLWPDDGMCSLRDCSVCECEEQEVPEPWRKAEAVEPCDSVQHESAVDRTLSPHMRASLLSVRDWRGYKNPWMPEGDDKVDFAYINLLRNSEKYTGYKGEHAARVWGAIYGQEMFRGINDPDTPPEQRVFYRLISGMHSSITAHVVGDYLIDEATQTWGPNLEMFKWRLGNPDVKDRVENLYFSYLFMLRAAMKAAPILAAAHYDTGNPVEDADTRDIMTRLVHNAQLQQTCPIPFDEGRLWKGEHSETLKAELQTTFHNITRIMDCVGCEKCKMWAKLQLLGIATSLKILFSAEDCSGRPGEVPGMVLERNEVIALFNTLERLAAAVEVVRDLSLQLSGNGKVHPGGVGAIQGVTGGQPLPEKLRTT